MKNDLRLQVSDFKQRSDEFDKKVESRELLENGKMVEKLKGELECEKNKSKKLAESLERARFEPNAYQSLMLQKYQQEISELASELKVLRSCRVRLPSIHSLNFV
jgi:hypothetical protein